MTTKLVGLNEEDGVILVTGASGFLGSHVIKQLLEIGCRVRGSVRSLSDEKKTMPLKNLVSESKFELELVAADLCDEKSWIDAVRSCSYVVHTASPVPHYVPDNADDVIKPAVSGVLNVLKACSSEDSTVKRVVLTSSLAAVVGDSMQDKVYTSQDFADEAQSWQAYTKSKIRAEKCAWTFMNENKPKFELVVINPGYIVGPILTETFTASMEVVKRLMNREISMLADIPLPGCDVRDVAAAHIAALKSTSSPSKRYIVLSRHEPERFQDYAEWLDEEFRQKGYSNIPTKTAPNFLIKMAGFFSKTVGFVVPMLGKKPKFNNQNFIDELGIEPLNTRDGFIQMAYTMIEKNFIPNKLIQ